MELQAFGEWRLETNEEEPNPMFKLVVCSNCNSKANHAYSYCPHCGAKMNKGKNIIANKYPRCRKCVYEATCSRDYDNEGTCNSYKRDPKDGGYYG